MSVASPALDVAPPLARRSIMVNTHAARALLTGAKTQLRRIVYPQPDDSGAWDGRRPYGAPGDRIWVREMWKPTASGGVRYAADYDDRSRGIMKPWIPPLGMPRSASRITLAITAIRMEPLQAIAPSDAVAEGVLRDSLSYLGPPLRNSYQHCRFTSAVEAFAAWWDWSYGSGGWDENPWVWAIGVRVVP